MKKFTFVFIGLLFAIGFIGSLARPCFAEIKTFGLADNEGLF